VIRRHAETDEPPRSREPLDHVDLGRRILARQELSRGVEGGGARADDGDSERAVWHPPQSRASASAQWEQPEPQPPMWVPSGSSSPSSTWKEWPQPHEETAFGLSILNPDSEMVLRKSMDAP
jgi:hypothetical protein